MLQAIDTSDADPALQPSESSMQRVPSRKDAKVYFEQVQLHPLSFSASFSADASMRNRDLAHDSRDARLRSDSSLIRNVLQNMGASVMTIRNAPLQLNGVVLRNEYETYDSIASRIAVGLRAGKILRRAYIILGSSEILGNPVGMFKNFGLGLYDFFAEPMKVS